MSANALTSLLYTALNDPHGRFVRTHDVPRLKAALHNAKRLAADPALDCITIRTSPADPNGEVWIIRTDLGANDANEAP